eukprot:TRINITY_DN559_c0_g1_i1.p1 TRINITY_DN559_c0_g1~~TRINITY_DN559_c0_g1_i1.p1  ORF type:complete len:109 (-),score=26.49 TRINITY_DN559_c0_g1_i1:62-388(-)
MTVKHVETFDEFKSTIGSGSLVVVDFYADWCGPCKRIAPFLETLSTQFADAKFIKVNVEEREDIAKECDISAMPTFHLYKDGKKVESLVGADQNKLKALVEKHAAAKA